MPINPYLNFAGNCRQAVEHYAQVFRGTPTDMMTFGEMPPPPDSGFTLPEEAKNLILHARLVIAGTTVMFSDVFPGMEFKAGNNVTLAIFSKDRDEVLNWFNKLSEGGSVHMPLQETFWSKLYGNVRDKFGIEWQVSLVESGENWP